MTPKKPTSSMTDAEKQQFYGAVKAHEAKNNEMSRLTSPVPVKRSRAQNVPGVPAQGQGLDNFTKSRMEQSRAAAANKTPPPRPVPSKPNVMGFPDPVSPIKGAMIKGTMPTNPTPGVRGAMGGQTGAVGPRPVGSPMPMGPKPMKKGGSVSASKRADGIAQRGKTKGTMC